MTNRIGENAEIVGTGLFVELRRPQGEGGLFRAVQVVDGEVEMELHR